MNTCLFTKLIAALCNGAMNIYGYVAIQQLGKCGYAVLILWNCFYLTLIGVDHYITWKKTRNKKHG